MAEAAAANRPGKKTGQANNTPPADNNANPPAADAPKSLEEIVPANLKKDLAAVQKVAADYWQAADRTDENLYKALGSVAAFAEKVKDTPEVVVKMTEAAGMKFPNKGNKIPTALVRLFVFGKERAEKEENKGPISRYSTAVDYLVKKGATGSAAVEFIKTNGGMTAVAQMARDEAKGEGGGGDGGGKEKPTVEAMTEWLASRPALGEVPPVGEGLPFAVAIVRPGGGMLAPLEINDKQFLSFLERLYLKANKPGKPVKTPKEKAPKLTAEEKKAKRDAEKAAKAAEAKAKKEAAKAEAKAKKDAEKAEAKAKEEAARKRHTVLADFLAAAGKLVNARGERLTTLSGKTAAIRRTVAAGVGPIVAYLADAPLVEGVAHFTRAADTPLLKAVRGGNDPTPARVQKGTESVFAARKHNPVVTVALAPAIVADAVRADEAAVKAKASARITSGEDGISFGDALITAQEASIDVTLPAGQLSAAVGVIRTMWDGEITAELSDSMVVLSGGGVTVTLPTYADAKAKKPNAALMGAEAIDFA